MYTIRKSQKSIRQLTDKSQKFQGNSGQTLLEMIIALALIIFFLSGIIVIELFAIRNIEYAQKKSLATKYAKQQLERARVVRDTSGFDTLSNYCYLQTCFINSQLTVMPVPVTPTGVFKQEFKIEATDQNVCPVLAAELTPVPTAFKATAIASWGQNITPAAQVEVSTCMTNWR